MSIKHLSWKFIRFPLCSMFYFIYSSAVILKSHAARLACEVCAWIRSNPKTDISYVLILRTRCLRSQACSPKDLSGVTNALIHHGLIIQGNDTSYFLGELPNMAQLNQLLVDLGVDTTQYGSFSNKAHLLAQWPVVLLDPCLRHICKLTITYQLRHRVQFQPQQCVKMCLGHWQALS